MTPTSPDVAIRYATAEHADEVAALLATVAHAGATARWLVPDPVDRRQQANTYFAAVVRRTLADPHGQIQISADHTAAAVWYVHPEPTRRRWAPPGLAPAAVRRFRLLDRLRADRHPHQAHHHLGYLAVHPDQRHHGVGSALLNHHHANLDIAGVPAYAEAGDPAELDFYLRHGYVTEGPLQVPDGPCLWPMWREPIGRPHHRR